VNEADYPAPSEQDEAVTAVQDLHRTTRWLAVSTLPLIIMALTTAFPLMSVGACLSWPVAIAATIVAVKAFWQARRIRQETNAPGAARTTLLMMVLCLLLLLGCTFLNMAALGSIRAASKSTISAANLMAIGLSVEQYAEKYAAYPPSLNAFVSDGSMSARSLVNPFVPQAPDYDPDAQLIYSSYIYKPGVGKYVSDPSIIIAYEREAFDVCVPYLFAPRERWVLFGDGQVRHLTEAEFAEAMRKDRRRREELRWPTATRPAASSPSESPGQDR